MKKLFLLCFMKSNSPGTGGYSSLLKNLFPDTVLWSDSFRLWSMSEDPCPGWLWRSCKHAYALWKWCTGTNIRICSLQSHIGWCRIRWSTRRIRQRFHPVQLCRLISKEEYFRGARYKLSQLKQSGYWLYCYWTFSYLKGILTPLWWQWVWKSVVSWS